MELSFFVRSVFLLICFWFVKITGRISFPAKPLCCFHVFAASANNLLILFRETSLNIGNWGTLTQSALCLAHRSNALLTNEATTVAFGEAWNAGSAICS